MADFGVMKTRKVRVTAMTFARLLKELAAGPCTATELHEATGLSKSTIYDYLRELRKAELVYISGFDRAANNCPSIVLYQWGPGEKDKKVRRITATERSRNYRRNKRDKETFERLTLLGQRAGENEDSQRVECPSLPPRVVARLNHGGDAVV